MFANVVLADEINRAAPKTQSALLEAMEERQVTVDGVGTAGAAAVHGLATQNPIDQEGTYPLPEAQLDRFLMRLTIGHPDLDNRDRDPHRAHGRGAARPACRDQHGERCPGSAVASNIYTAPKWSGISRCWPSRPESTRRLGSGISTRGSLALLRCAQAFAAGHGRHFVVPDDVKTVAGPVLTHRLVLTAEAEVRGASAADVLAEVIRSVPVPAVSRR